MLVRRQPTIGQIQAFCVTLVIWAAVVAPWVCVLHCHLVMHNPAATELFYVCSDMVSDSVEHQHNRALPMSLWLTLAVAVVTFNEKSMRTWGVSSRNSDFMGIDSAPTTPPPRV
jgi:hypothetical protein